MRSGLGVGDFGAEVVGVEFVGAESDLGVHGELELGLFGSAVEAGKVGDGGNISFADEEACAGKLLDGKASEEARISTSTSCTPGRILF